MLEKNEYYSSIYQEIEDSFVSNTMQTGLGQEVLDEIITEEQVKEDVNSFIYYIYGEGKMTIDTEALKERLQKNIDKVIEKNNKNVTKDEQKEINIYINTIADIYEDGILYANSYVDTMRNVIEKVGYLIEPAQIAGYVASAVILLILLLINKSNVLNYVAICMMCVGILLVVPKIVENSTLQIHNILLFNLAFSKVLINVIENIIFYFLITGIFIFILGLIINVALFSFESLNISKINSRRYWNGN